MVVLLLNPQIQADPVGSAGFLGFFGAMGAFYVASLREVTLTNIVCKLADKQQTGEKSQPGESHQTAATPTG